MTRQTYRESLAPPPGADVLVDIWSDDLLAKLMGYVWQAYDELYRTTWSKVSWTEEYSDVERSLSEDLERTLREQMRRDSFLSITVQHAPSEREARSKTKANAQPPQYDIAFQWHDPRIMWPLEAKVLKSDKNTQANLKDYIQTLQDRYLTCYYAPFSNGGAMIGYLKTGDAEEVIQHIANRLSTPLAPHPTFTNRCHKTSDHQRVVPPGKDYPVHFRCHHLILPLTKY